MTTSRDHSNLKNLIRIELGRRKDVVVWNNESGVAEYGSFMVRYGVGKGGSDLIGIVNTGRFIALEVKTGNAVPDKNQKLFLRLVNKFGGYGVVVRSVQDAVNAVEKAINNSDKDG